MRAAGVAIAVLHRPSAPAVTLTGVFGAQEAVILIFSPGAALPHRRASQSCCSTILSEMMAGRLIFACVPKTADSASADIINIFFIAK